MGQMVLFALLFCKHYSSPWQRTTGGSRGSSVTASQLQNHLWQSRATVQEGWELSWAHAMRAGVYPCCPTTPSDGAAWFPSGSLQLNRVKFF